MISAWREELYFLLLRMRISYLYACTFLFLLAIVAAWWYCIYAPIQGYIHVDMHAMAGLQQHYSDMKNIEHDIVVLKNSIAQLKNNYQMQANKISDQKVAAQSMYALMQTAEQAGLAIASCRSCGKREKSWCSVYETNIELFGSLDQMISFFSSLKEKLPTLACKNFEIIHKEKENFGLRASLATIAIDLKQKTLQLNS